MNHEFYSWKRMLPVAWYEHYTIIAIEEKVNNQLRITFYAYFISQSILSYVLLSSLSMFNWVSIQFEWIFFSRK